MKLINKGYFSVSRLMALILLSLLAGCKQGKEAGLTIVHGNIQLEINEHLYTRLTSLDKGSKKITEGFANSETIFLEGLLTPALFTVKNISEETLAGDIAGKMWTVRGVTKENGLDLEKILVLKVFDSFPGLISTQVKWVNHSSRNIVVNQWKNNSYAILSQQDTPSFWAFQGSSTKKRSDWIRPLSEGYYDKNFMGMNDSDYGGGIPVTAVWRKDQGVAVGHLAMTPKEVSLPTAFIEGEDAVFISVQDDLAHRTVLGKGNVLETLETFVMVHSGDYYNALTVYSELMQQKGIKMATSEEAAFESIWCAWGYERDFTLDEILGTLPKVKELGIKWVVLDDGFQYAEGDWNANKAKFPRGNIEIKELVDKIHNAGMKAKVWWTPLAADPHSELLKTNPEMRLLLSNGSPQYITWWDAYYLSPANKEVLAHTKQTIKLFMEEWGFDGLKMDGQHMNAVAPDYSDESGVASPELAPEKVPDYFQMIYDEATRINPHAVIENCPCGTCMSFFNMPSMNQAVASDPLSSWQIRHKGKTYKALIPETAYFGDHVELSDNADDFATSFGIGAVLGTKFTWPRDNPKASGKFLLTPQKEAVWKKWFDLYETKKLSKEEYLGGLYDIGYHFPESHAIKKGDIMHYAFYNKDWKGKIELKGLAAGKSYEIIDYYNGKKLASINGSEPFIDVVFKDFLLVEAKPVN